MKAQTGISLFAVRHLSELKNVKSKSKIVQNAMIYEQIIV